MNIHTLTVGQLATNCYLVIDEPTKSGIIIDPGDDADFVIRRIQDLDFQSQFILATHGHFDHILAVTELKLAFQIPFLLHQKDEFLMTKSKKSAEYWLEIEEVDPALKPDQYIKEGDVVTVGESSLEVIETPGHTPGSISLYNNKESTLFCGDTIFADGFIGRTDFSYGDAKELRRSIEKLLKLPKNTKVYPGHGQDFLLEDFNSVSWWIREI